MSSLKRAIRREAVTPIRPLTHLAAGQAALRRGAWKEAKRHFQAALAQAEQPEAHEGLGLAAWWLDLSDLIFSSRQRAYRLYLQRDATDTRNAAADQARPSRPCRCLTGAGV
jgi:uncharacterized protein HemY